MSLTIICHNPGVIAAINQRQIATWSRNGWKTSKGKEVKHAEAWQRIEKLIRDKVANITARPPEDSETDIMHKLGAETFSPKTPLR